MRRFPEAATRKGAFTLSTGDRVDVPLMQGRAAAAYLDARDFQALALPFAAYELSMIVLLPKTVDGLAALERTLTAARLAEWLAGMTVHDMDLVLPRFKVAARSRVARQCPGRHSAPTIRSGSRSATPTAAACSSSAV